MKIIKLADIHIEEIVEELRRGATVVYPTETCYGLGCDATNQQAVDNIFKIKNRQAHKPLLVVADDPALIKKHVVWDETLTRIADIYWPGALTVVAQASDMCELAEGVRAKDNTIAFRITEHPLIQDLVQGLGAPLVSTSANIASHASPYDVREVLQMFEHKDDKPDILIDAGELPHQSPSTIIKVADGEITVLRQGGVIVSELF